MGVTFIEALAEDSRAWEILGARNLLIDNEQDKISIVIFCFSPPDCPLYHRRYQRRKVKAFEASLSALRHLAAGSVWRNGVRLRPMHWAHHAGDIIGRKCELILNDSRETTDEVIKKLNKAKNLHSEFLTSINYLQYEHTGRTLYIPCSEVMRTFFAPTERLLKIIVTGKTEDVLNPNNRSKFKSLTSAELRAVELYTASTAGISAVRHPYKSIKLTHISNVMFKQRGLFLISAKLPVSGLHSLWTLGTRSVQMGNNRSNKIITLLEADPQNFRSRKYHEQHPVSRDVGPHDLLLSDLEWRTYRK